MALIDVKDIPAGARLELRWREGTEQEYAENRRSVDGHNTSVQVCDYLLIIPLTEGDVRRQDSNAQGDVICYHLGHTTERANKHLGHSQFTEYGIARPKKDGQHAVWDAVHLGNLPVWVTYAGKAMRVEVEHDQ